MGSAKDIILRPVSSSEANALVRRVHYSGKVVNNSQLHIGVFYNGKLEGVMQFGPSLDKRKIMDLVEGTGWNEFLELNRLAFSDALPRNSESRALSIVFKMIRKHAPHVKWIISFADATQCGDGTIYRAAGFVLTGIKKNNQIWQAPDGVTAARLVKTNLNPGSGRDKYIERYLPNGARFSRTSLTDGRSKKQQSAARAISRVTATKGSNVLETGGASMKPFIEAGFTPMDGYQLRYIYFLDPSYRARLTVPELPYSEIERRGARMYKGERLSCGSGEIDNATQSNVQTEGASPIEPL